MSSRPFIAALGVAALLGAGGRPAPLIVYSAPAGTRPTGADRIHPSNAILPDGRLVAPSGANAFIGARPFALALTPDGRFAILSNGGAGSSLSVIDTRTMRSAAVVRDPAGAIFTGVAVSTDPEDRARTVVLVSDAGTGVVRTYALGTDGQLTSSGSAIALPPDAMHASFPTGIAVTADARTAYVADTLGDRVIPVDLAQRTALPAVAAGNFPMHVAASANQVIASASGLSRYSPVATPVPSPQFAAPTFDPSVSSSLTVFELLASSAIGDPESVPMDRAPDGTEDVGGASPGATVVSRDGQYAYVALANVDRVAVVALHPQPHVVRGLDLRLYPGAPYGAQPSAEALSPDGKRLYVALAGLNAVAVLDAKRAARYRYGLIPTGWYPTAMQLSRDGRYLYVAAAKGVDGQGTLQRIDLKRTYLVRATLDALRYNRTPRVARFDPVIPPLGSNRRSETIDHVVYVAFGSQSYDAMLGDLTDASDKAYGNGDPALNRYPATVTPNLHALARSYALAENFYAADALPEIAREFALAGGATLYQQSIALAGARAGSLGELGDDPEDYGRGGYIFNALARGGLTYRDYGALLQLSGFDGSAYHLDVPALAALSGNVDLQYSNAATKPLEKPVQKPNEKRNEKPSARAPEVATTPSASMRADEFVNDMQRYVASDRMPNFVYVSLPAPADLAAVTDADRALGKIVEYISHTPHWSSTAIFIVGEGLDGTALDHVSPLRSYAIVVSPLAKRAYLGDAHLSEAGVLKTEEEIFGLPALSLNDLLASDFSGFFATAPAPEPFQAQ
ncbi:MAG: bifunctional YncE family protein/alkaline phosphatase family protein [Candidatus Eremiobacteraeota bacterium]|nr:bifunctional YncE family protein/alkaline phosphatase family protein [Candidatus Eremiobacteraeota bacterium]MBV9057406.1 bifunctional YncE family protein/alkaline phosphatase family protein [Candidatus Eremiobacteraeota bacterium]MBV9699239.1 bifunctional YncE family protein/alkaline phosphatase family protein [Candidatus Eremiobacteraeota bacterium]